ncbi:HAD-IA family hydrolase [Streptomyces virginiae]|uniref:HAD-IA family hydrolase n=1 Tax=Streptomyces TaxID=1883 RepID=UPI002E290911|nr:HAD-IA family hydrolase [Streptomyces sp. NBC_00239]WSY02165.1 HAD-IA family hydrolase [Streptomyces goshikiensis]
MLCDVGDVLIKFDRGVAEAIERRHGLAEGSLLPAVLKSQPGRLAMAGAIDHNTWRAEVGALVGPGAVEAWLRYHGDLDSQAVACLKAVRDRGVRVVLLSNANGRLRSDLAFHGISDVADLVLGSAEMGLLKPDPRCYQEAARLGGFAFHEALYVDDTPSWVAAGEVLGMTGHTFTSARALNECLISKGLLS